MLACFQGWSVKCVSERPHGYWLKARLEMSCFSSFPIKMGPWPAETTGPPQAVALKMEKHFTLLQYVNCARKLVFRSTQLKVRWQIGDFQCSCPAARL